MSLLYLVAGDPSGDRLDAGLMQALKAEASGVRFGGIGGPMMAGEGLRSLFDYTDLGEMGIAELAPRLCLLMRRIKQTVADVHRAQPAALVTIASPGFGLRVAERVRRSVPQGKTIHYVAASVWAWRPGRARRMARYIDHVLALLPFEPPYMTAEGMSCDFVGHPAAVAPRSAPEAIAAFRTRAGAAAGRPLLLLAPGTRRGEVARMMPVFAEMEARLRQRHPELAVAIPVSEAVAWEVAEAATRLEMPPVLVRPAEGEEGRQVAFAAADLALVASRTVVVEMAAATTPMVSAYRTSWLTGQSSSG